MTVKTEITKANPNNLPDALRVADLGEALGGLQRTVVVAVPATNIATLPFPARQVLACFATAAGTPGWKTVMVQELTPPAATQCSVDPAGNVLFAAADAVTAAEITYIPVEGALIVNEVIPVTAAGLGTFANGKRAVQVVTAVLNAPAALPGAKLLVPRNSVVAVPGTCATVLAAATIQFLAADCGAICTATVTYYAMPGIGIGSTQTLGSRIEAAYVP